MEKQEIEQKLNKFFNEKNPNKEQKKMETVVEAVNGSLSDVYVDKDTGQAVEVIIKTGKIDDGSEYGKKIFLTDATTKAGKQIFYIYEKIGYAFSSPELNKKGEKNKHTIDGSLTYNVVKHTTNGESIATSSEKKLFGYNNSKENESTGKVDEWIGLSLIKPL